MTRHRTTLRGLMIAVAVCAGGLFAARAEPDPTLGFLIVVASIAGLAALRTVQGIRHHRSLGRPLTHRRMVATLVGSTTVAFTIVAISDLVFIIVQALLSTLCHHNIHRPTPVSVEGILAGSVCAILVAGSLRRRLWHQASPRACARHWRLGIPCAMAIILVGLLVGSVSLRHSYDHHRNEADRHREMLRRVPVGSKDAAVIRWLIAWHERAAFCPWFPNRPDRYPVDLR